MIFYSIKAVIFCLFKNYKFCSSQIYSKLWVCMKKGDYYMTFWKFYLLIHQNPTNVLIFLITWANQIRSNKIEIHHHIGKEGYYIFRKRCKFPMVSLIIPFIESLNVSITCDIIRNIYWIHLSKNWLLWFKLVEVQDLIYIYIYITWEYACRAYSFPYLLITF